jgi:phosphoglycolate phosphatase
MVVSEHTILWDWNGTLLDDAQTCMDTMNEMLKRRGMPVLNMEIYKDVFGFPVYDYYRKIGFDFDRESFEDLSVEFIDAYNHALGSAPLAGSAREVLEYFRAAGKQNVIVSAMKQDMLLKSVKDKGIGNYFADILGIHDIYAASKSEMAMKYVKSRKLDISEIIFIGDTEHDFDVALDIGCRCILIADGHQSEERLRATGAEVLPSLEALINGMGQGRG